MFSFKRAAGAVAVCFSLFQVSAVQVSAVQAAVQTDEPLIRDHVVGEIREWANSPVVTMTLDASNDRYADLDQSGIDAVDKQWREEREKDDQPLITAVLSSPLSSYLTKIQARSRGLYSEIFVMDAKGLNAGQSAITSDFWQGDEAKWQKTFLVGPDALFIDEIEINEDVGTENAQVNMSIARDGKVIGAITVEINVTELRRRVAAGKV